MLVSGTTKWLTVLIVMVVLCYLPATPSISTGNEEDADQYESLLPEEIINPHFTGKDCNLCHEEVPEPGDSNLRLKFGGDDIAMCNSCHEAKQVKGEIHPVGIIPPEGNSINIPDTFPLYERKITCRTCHDVYLQCRAKPSVQFENIDFLWGAPYKKTTDFCFRCHKIEDYKKTNPHEQLDKEGNILEERCLYCHQTLPDPYTVSGIENVGFRTETSTFCIACHGAEETLHPANANHMLAPPQEMLTAIEASENKYGVILPLLKGEVFCGTCHNPHEKGVIKREEAVKGSDAEYHVRLDWSYDLCVSCHIEKEDLSTRTVDIDIRDKDLILSTRGEDIPSYHKAFLEKKCRACHTTTRESPERPIVYKMCFQADCHDASIIEGTFKHSDAQKGNCLLCHSQHGSQYGAHIVNDQRKLCKACHPLLKRMEEKEDEEEAGEDFHDYYLALFRKLVPDQEVTCCYCHGEDHSEKVYKDGIVSCYKCHNYIKQLIKGKQGKPENIHETFIRFVRDNCTYCHDPHSSSYPYLLKKEPESYK